MIGIIGGMGPTAGVHLVEKLIKNTAVHKDQDHLPVLLLSVPHQIPDRSAYIMGEAAENPGKVIGEFGAKLIAMGCTTLGIACNTAHSPCIFDVAQAIVSSVNPSVKFVSMVESTMLELEACLPKATAVGVLCTNGTYKTGLYRNALRAHGFDPIFPDWKEQARYVHEAIYAREFGLKQSLPSVVDTAIDFLQIEIDKMRMLGTEAIVLACTELSLVRERLDVTGMVVIDSSEALARGLVHAYRSGR